MGKYTNIDDPSAFFQIKKWTGNGGTNAITLDGNSDMQPDLMWHKEQNDTNGWHQFDSTRGVDKYLNTSDTAGSGTFANYLSSFDSNGFTAGSGDSSMNSSSTAQCSWLWKANGGTTSTNTAGTINTTIQTNSDAGFSICRHDGNGTSGATFGHGLGVKPDFIIAKRDDGVTNWRCYHSSLGATKTILLNTADAAFDSSDSWNNTEPTSTLVSVGNGSRTNATGSPILFWIFASKQGYSKFGSYVGNGSGTDDGNFDGVFVYLGFKPAWVLIKPSSASAGDGWVLFDNTRAPRAGSTTGNYNQNQINPASSAAESGAVYDAVDFLSNGFKARTGRNGVNDSGRTYIYTAFAENPFTTSTGIPTTAR